MTKGMNTQDRQPACAGFTLLELLIAVAIFALIGAMAYGGLQTVMDQQLITGQQSQRLADLQKAYRIMQRDLEQMVDRQIRNEFGEQAAALVGGSAFSGVEFSRAGHPNPAGFLRSEILRVAYVPDQDRLLRRTWRVLDRAQDSQPDEDLLVVDMQDFNVRFLSHNNEWSENWPPLEIQTPQPGEELPRAMEVELDLDGIGVLNWIFRMPEALVVGAQPGVGGSGGDDEEEAGQQAEDEE